MALALALLVVPGASGSAFGGAPLSLAGRIGLGALATAGVAAWLFRHQRVGVPWLVAVLLLTLAKLGLSIFDVPAGWTARVYREATPAAAESFFWRFAERDYRIDPVIGFDGPSFGLHFLNDIHFNTGRYQPIRRDEGLAWRAEWRGYVTSATQQAIRGSLRAAGDVRVVVDGVEVLRATDPMDLAFDILQPATAPVRVDVVYDKPAGTRPSIHLQWEPEASVQIGSTPEAAQRYGAQRGRGVATTAIVACGLVVVWSWLAVSMWRRAEPRWGRSRVVAALVVAGYAAVTAGALVLADRYAGQTYHMSEGNDPLVYEGHARDIMAHGPLMLAGAPLGQAKPYFHYPLYPYVVASMHWIIGEDAAAVMLGNGLMVAAVLPLLWVLGWHRLRAGAGAVMVVLAGAAIGRHALPYTVEVFTDNLFLPLVFVGLNLGVWAVRSNRGVAWWLTGAVVALGAATRPSLLTYLPFLLAAVVYAGGRSEWRWSTRAAALLALGFATAVLPFTIRNYVVSGQLVMLVNSWVGLAVFLVPPGESYSFIYSGRPLGLWESAAQAIRIFIEYPVRTVGLELRKVFFTLGFTNLVDGGVLRADLVAFSLAGLTALGRGLLDRPILLVTGAFAASHVTAMVLAAPWTYGYKSILPLQFLFLFWAGFLAERQHRVTGNRG